MAPEVLKKTGQYTPAIDVFSYAVILWYLAACEEPFGGENFNKNYRDLIIQGKRLEIPSTCLPDLAAMIQICWQQNPTDRPEFSQIVFILEPLFWQLKTVEDANMVVKASQTSKSGLFGRKKNKWASTLQLKCLRCLRTLDHSCEFFLFHWIKSVSTSFVLPFCKLRTFYLLSLCSKHPTT